MIDAFSCVYNWFRINLLSLNINKTHCVQFKTKNKSTPDINIVCNNRRITTMSNICICICICIYFHPFVLHGNNWTRHKVPWHTYK
jgi:hypothetical protein